MGVTPTVLLIGEIAAGGRKQLERLTPFSARWTAAPSFDHPTLPELLPAADIVVCNRFLPSWGPMARRLKLLQLHSTGFDNVSFADLPEGCLVANVYGHDRAIAEFVMMQLIALRRRLIPRDSALRRGDWITNGLDRELSGTTLGIVGFGAVGAAVAPLARAFGMRIVAINRSPDPALAQRHGLDWLAGSDELETLLQEADAVLAAVPLNATTQGMIGRREIASLRSDAVILNIGRAAVIDEEALYDALFTGALAGYAGDVWWSYPKDGGAAAPSRFPFAAFDTVVMTPHIAALTEGTFERRWRAVSENMMRFVAGEPLTNRVGEPASIGA